MSPSTDQIASERAGPRSGTPLVLIHAGVADRRMWDDIWSRLTAVRDVVRLDLRGYGESTARPEGSWSQRAAVWSALEDLSIRRAHLIGCSYGAGLCAELALETPDLAASLLLVSPAGSLLTERTDDLGRFLEAEGAALDRGDLDAAVEANLVHWVDGPHRGPDVVPATVRDAVRRMQRLAFEITLPWADEVWEAEEEPDVEPSERLAEITAPTLVLQGGLDMATVRHTADQLVAQVPDVRLVTWPDVAHLPSMERPDDFVELVLGWVTEVD